MPPEGLLGEATDRLELAALGAGLGVGGLVTESGVGEALPPILLWVDEELRPELWWETVSSVDGAAVVSARADVVLPGFLENHKRNKIIIRHV